jgi:hypothetical protein
MIRDIFFLLILTWSQSGLAFDHSHELFDQILHDVVVSKYPQTQVDYDKLTEDQGKFEQYLNEVESVSKNEFRRWSKEQQLAFLINAYNAFTLKLILSAYPDITSIRDLGGLIFSSPWKKKFFTLFGKKAHLDYIENGLLRKKFQEPRIHFAIVCASRSCPPLQPDAFVAMKLEQQLEHASRSFLRDPERNRYDRKTNRLEISSIFNWFRVDFEKAAGSIEAFIAPYITDDPEIRILLANRAVRVHFLDYDWSLNNTN